MHWGTIGEIQVRYTWLDISPKYFTLLHKQGFSELKDRFLQRAEQPAHRDGFHSVALIPVISTYTKRATHDVHGDSMSKRATWRLMGRSGAMSRVTIVITHIRGLITPVITTHEPPSRRAAGTQQAREHGHPKAEAAHETSVKSQVPALILSCTVGFWAHRSLGARVRSEFRV